MTDASSTSEAGGTVASDGAADGDGAATGPGGDRPERPPPQRLVDALGVVEHARRGFAVGVALAVGVFGFFVVVPALDPGTASRTESPVLFLALAFVVATSGTLLVGSALAVRAVAGRVMAYGKWVRRGAVVAAAGGAAWAVVGALALATGDGVVPATLETAVLVVLPLPVLALGAGVWIALARTGAPSVAAGGDARTDAVARDAFDHVAERPRPANVAAVVALAGTAFVHVATFLDVEAFLGSSAPAPASAVVVGTTALAVGTFALAAAVADRVDATALPAAAAAFAAVAAGLAVGGALAGAAAATPVAAAVLPGLAWLALGVAVARDTGAYPERPV